jgi:hypothetical protein
MDGQESVGIGYIAPGGDDGAGKFQHAMKTTVVGLEMRMGTRFELERSKAGDHDRSATLDNADAAVGHTGGLDDDRECVAFIENVHCRFPITPYWS